MANYPAGSPIPPLTLPAAQNISNHPVWSDPGHWHPFNFSTRTEISANLVRMICMRMRWQTQEGMLPNIPFDHIYAARVGDDKVAIFLVNHGQWSVLEDGWDLFPSDTLVTQLRLITGK